MESYSKQPFNYLFTQLYSLEPPAPVGCMYQYFRPSYCQAVFHGMGAP